MEYVILPKTPKDLSFEETVSKLTSLFGASESVISRRYRCLQILKQPREDYVTYACRINKSCVEFELTKLSEEQFKCLVFVCGLKSERDAEVRTRLLTRIEEKCDVTMEQLSEENQRLLNLRHNAAMIEDQTDCVKALKSRQHPGRFPARQPKQGSKDGFDSRSNASGPKSACWLCDANHYARDCSFKNHKCSDCGTVGHKEGYCHSAGKAKFRRSDRRKGNAAAKVVTVNACSATKYRKYVPVDINGSSVRLQLDTGSDITIISMGTWRKIGSPSMCAPTIVTKTAAGKILNIEGEFSCEMMINDMKSEGTVRVSREQIQLLGSDMMEVFGLWSVPFNAICCQVGSKTSYVETLKAEFPAVFSDKLGICTKMKIKLELKSGKSPVFRPKRPVAYAMQRAVDDELDRLEQEQIITPVDFAEWAVPIVVVRKSSGSIRICGDYSTGLNDSLQPHQYPLPLPQDIFASLANSTVFSQIDLTDSFLQMEMDEGSADHMRNLRAVLDRIKEYGFKIRLSKCSFGKEQIRYLGH
ncbi:uncharacterized protein K02A2.6-like [Ochlerotatus camptorhynchus]|uniref:uncharacterized protein K02A2.6-like n=1 Tax=Ochlerotatus camptorhynchus TaxID=644619 RepID=UPI0031D9B6EB